MRAKDQENYRLIVKAINDYTAQNGCSPTVREIADEVGVSRSTVTRYVQEMIADGRLRSKGRRSYMTEKTPTDLLRVPILGEVACGLPSYAEENIEAYVHLPRALFGNGDYYMLRARGYSMIDVGIASGDFVLIRRQNTAEPGEIVVALVEEEATLKRYYPEPERHRIRLHPENHVMDDIIVSDCEIQGVAVKVLKDL